MSDDEIVKETLLLKVITESEDSASFGDSGGPLECSGVLYGITSVGFSVPIFGNYYNFFTDVNAHTEWIEEIIEKHDYDKFKGESKHTALLMEKYLIVLHVFVFFIQY